MLNHTLKLLKKDNSSTEYNDVLDARMTSLLESFYKLKPINRTKRGILNPIGTIIKSITGNLDENDLNDIHKTFDQTENKINELIKNNERQIEINRKFENKMNIIIDRINNQQSKILKLLTKLGDETTNTNYKDLLIRQHIHDTLFNIELLDRKLRDIFESIQFARIGILSKTILNPNETNFALEKLESQNITIKAIDQVYEFLDIDVFHNNSNILFIVKIPMFLKGTFYYINYESIPNNNRTISSSYNIAVTSEESTFATKEDCPIIENYRICQQHALVNITNNGCIHNMLWGHNATCPYIEFKESFKIKRINTNTLLMINVIKPITINSTCEPAIRTVTGTILITFDDCVVTINNEKYDTRKTTGYDDTKLISTIGVNINATSFSNKPDIPQLHKFNILNKKHIDEIKIHQNIIRNSTISGFFLLLIMSCSLGVWILLSTKRQRETTIALNIANSKESTENSQKKIRDESFQRGEKLTTFPCPRDGPSSASCKQPSSVTSFTFPALKA